MTPTTTTKGPDGPTFLSTFSGIGGLDHGLERAGWRPVAQCERDPWRREVLAARFPGVPVFDDVGGDDLVRFADEHRGRVDALVGGVPCQDWSVAGRRRGLGGARSGLFFTFADLARRLAPRWVLLENVGGLLSADAYGLGAGSDFATVLEELTGWRPEVPDDGWRNAGVCAGPDRVAVWRVLDSRFAGVPQRRRRVFLVAEADSRAVGALALLPELEGRRRNPPAGGPAGTEPPPAAGDGAPLDGVADTIRTHPRPGSTTPGAVVVAASSGRGYWSDQDESATLGTQGAGVHERTLIAPGGVEPSYFVEDFENGTLTSDEGRTDRRPLLVTREVAAPLTSGRPASSRPAGRRLEDDTNLVSVECATGDVTHALTAEGFDASEDGTGRGHPIVAVPFAKAHGAASSDDDETWREAETARSLTADGRALVAGASGALVATPEVAHTITSKAAANGTGHSPDECTYLPTAAGGVRRLTPVECERLQGLPDDWTAPPELGGPGVYEERAGKWRLLSGVPDGRRYAALGDAVTANVAEWVGRRVAEGLRT